jgi:two-component system, OmpR family, alkaline phosphatase synthesis response regulator PhoP
MASKKILLVDDNVDFVESNKDLLEANGYQVSVAYDGAAGLEKAKQERPDLIILDVMMAHDTEGFEVSRKVPQQPELRNTKVILVTGIRKEKHLAYNFEPDETWLPVEKILEKPVPPETLLDEVKKALR